MKSVLTSQLKTGLKLNADIMLDSKYVLITPGLAMESEMIERLKKWGYQRIFALPSSVEKKKVSPRTEESTSMLEEDIKDREGIENAQKTLKTSMETAARVFTRFQKSGALPINDVSDMVKDLLNHLREDSRYILRISEFGTKGHSYMASHAVRTALLSLGIGEQLKMPQHKLVELGISAILHEIGMLKLPPDFLETDRKLTDAEKKMITAHPVLGYKILKESSLNREIQLGALEHHERMDGSGYPQALPGKNISLYARIIAVACSYDAQISQRPYSAAKTDHLSIIEMLQGGGNLYDENIIRRMVFLLSLYPIGSYVKLHSGEIATVIDGNPDNPRLPRLRLLFDAQGDPLKDQPVITAEEEGGLRIIRDVAQDEMKNYMNRT